MQDALPVESPNPNLQPASPNIHVLADRIMDIIMTNVLLKKKLQLLFQSIVEAKLECINSEFKQPQSATENWEQCSRRNCLLIHGLPSQKFEIIDQTVIDIFHSQLGITATDQDLDRFRRVG